MQCLHVRLKFVEQNFVSSFWISQNLKFKVYWGTLQYTDDCSLPENQARHHLDLLSEYVVDTHIEDAYWQENVINDSSICLKTFFFSHIFVTLFSQHYGFVENSLCQSCFCGMFQVSGDQRVIIGTLWPVPSKCYISWLPKNMRKPCGFLIFSGSIEM